MKYSIQPKPKKGFKKKPLGTTGYAQKPALKASRPASGSKLRTSRPATRRVGRS